MSNEVNSKDYPTELVFEGFRFLPEPTVFYRDDTEEPIAIIPSIWGRLAIPAIGAETSKTKGAPTNCKNCGAPLKLNNCSYCNTVY